MHNLSSVYFVKHLYLFRAYLKPIIRRYTYGYKNWYLLFFLDVCLSVVLAGFQPSQDNRQTDRGVDEIYWR